jgi:glucosamine--fructose-6-phosphate aminotransferase (isomerizing)
MCGIAGCVGHEGAPEFVLGALANLEYRGYDSAGIGYPESDHIEIVRAVGKLANLVAELGDSVPDTDTAIGHTRWATHGRKVVANAHPHTNEDSTIAVVVNGIFENYVELKESLLKNGHIFRSETDTEIVPHLIESYLDDGYEPEAAFEASLAQLDGNFAVLAMMAQSPGKLYAANVGAPLAIGVAETDGRFVASDPLAFSERTNKVVILEDNDLAIVTRNDYHVGNYKEKVRTTPLPQDLADLYEEEHAKAELGNFPHYMLKEIHDSAETVHLAIRGRILADEGIVKLGGLESVQERLRNINRVIIVSCGTSYFAGLIGESLIEEVAELPVEVQLASEFSAKNEPIDKNTAILAISQSGETADTVAALKKAKELNLLTLGIVNAPGSTISRLTDAGVYCRAGEERSVASTKAFTSQVTILSEVALALAKQSNDLSRPLMRELTELPATINQFLEDTSQIKHIAEKYADSKNFLFIGRGYNYPNAMEGALKLKEVSYIHAEGISSGEMKHGTIALIDENFPTVAVATDTPDLEKIISNIQEIKARSGPIIAIASEGNSAIADIVDDVIYVPKTMEQVQPILNGIALQLFAYYVAAKKGVDIDQPRNLAKSVTVG